MPSTVDSEPARDAEGGSASSPASESPGREPREPERDSFSLGAPQMKDGARNVDANDGASEGGLCVGPDGPGHPRAAASAPPAECCCSVKSWSTVGESWLRSRTAPELVRRMVGTGEVDVARARQTAAAAPPPPLGWRRTMVRPGVRSRNPELRLGLPGGVIATVTEDPDSRACASTPAASLASPSSTSCWPRRMSCASSHVDLKMRPNVSSPSSRKEPPTKLSTSSPGPSPVPPSQIRPSQTPEAL
mmetsp:Transcript_28196/g.83043  ORF Transcript_28196/g.83043 Transcript_28196/m.83043 type:complete len:247 (-) Transcript_28196:556-1296(-)